MRYVKRKRQTLWLWWCSLIYGVPTPLPEVPPGGWQGATEGWSPKAAVEAVEGRKTRGGYVPPQWWAEDARRRLHTDLDMIENSLHSGLEAVLAAVYAWRDSEVMA